MVTEFPDEDPLIDQILDAWLITVERFDRYPSDRKQIISESYQAINHYNNIVDASLGIEDESALKTGDEMADPRDPTTNTMVRVSSCLQEVEAENIDILGGDMNKSLEATIEGVAMLLHHIINQNYPETAEQKTDRVVEIVRHKSEALSAVHSGKVIFLDSVRPQ